MWSKTLKKAMPSIWQAVPQVREVQSLCETLKVVQILSQTTDTEQTDDTLFIDAVQKQGQTEVKTDECFSTLHVQGTPIQLKIDIGSQENIIPVRKL